MPTRFELTVTHADTNAAVSASDRRLASLTDGARICTNFSSTSQRRRGQTEGTLLTPKSGNRTSRP
jgi:hypothetical protein